MITKSRLFITLLDMFMADKPAHAAVRHDFTVSARHDISETVQLCDMSGTGAGVTVDAAVVSPHTSSRTETEAGPISVRYPLHLTHGTHTVTVTHSLPLMKRSAPRLVCSVYGYHYTVYYDFFLLRRIGIANDADTAVIVEIPHTLPFFTGLICGRWFIRFGSKSRDEEKGVLHRTTIRRFGRVYRSELTFPYSMPDQIAVTAGLTGFL
ncbi:MAG: hypothetical protein ACOC2H_02810 [Spirochaetota bacterium]